MNVDVSHRQLAIDHLQARVVVANLLYAYRPQYPYPGLHKLHPYEILTAKQMDRIGQDLQKNDPRTTALEYWRWSVRTPEWWTPEAQFAVRLVDGTILTTCELARQATERVRWCRQTGDTTLIAITVDLSTGAEVAVS